MIVCLPNVSKGLAVFVGAFAGFVEYAEIGGVAALGYALLVESFEYGATGLMGVSAVSEAAFLRQSEYFREIMSYFFGREFDSAEAAYSGCVDDFASAGQIEHLGECGGVHAGVVCGRYFAGTQVEAGYECIDECGLAYT